MSQYRWASVDNVVYSLFGLLEQSILAITLVSIFLLFCIPKVYAATYYVAGDTGSDSYSAAQAQSTATPWATIQKAADTMVAGDTVNVKGGVTYTAENACNSLAGEITVVCIKAGGNSSNYITYKAWPNTGVPRIVMQGSAGNGFTVLGNTKPYIIIDGFDISGYGAGSNPAGIQIPRNNNANYIIRNNVFHDSSRGILLSFAGLDIKIYNNTFYNLKADGGGGSGVTLWSNVAADIQNNIFYANDIGIFSDGGVGSLGNNIVYGNAANYLNISSGLNDLSTEPLFTDPENGDFTLLPSSPAINAGADLTANGVTTDILGRARPNAGAFDIGAFEDPNLYVAGDTGSDSNNGSMSSPFLTIQKGADVASAGDNVNVKGGIEYTGNNFCVLGDAVACINTTSGTSTNRITYKAWQDTGIPIVDANGKTGGFIILLQSYINIEGFEIKNASVNTKVGIINFMSSYSTIKNNIIRGNQYGIYFNNSSNNTIINNTVYGNTFGLQGDGTCNNIIVTNNIISLNTNGYSGTGLSSATVDYNVVFNNTNYNSVTPGAHDIVEDPLFTNVVSNNVTLLATSPAINSGTDLSASGVTTDILGVSRAQGSAYDIGAYEYVPEVSTNTTSPFESNVQELYQIAQSNAADAGGGVYVPVKDSNTGGQKVTLTVQPQTILFNAYVSAHAKTPSEVLQQGSLLSKQTLTDNHLIIAGNLNHGYLGLRTNTGISWQVGKILSVWYKAYPPGGSSSAPALIIPELQSKPSIISLSYTIPDIVPLGDISHPFNPQNFKIAHSFDGLKWTILSESVVDRVNMTVATVNKVGGYYMIVSSEF